MAYVAPLNQGARVPTSSSTGISDNYGVLKTINQEIQDYRSKYIVIVPGMFQGVSSFGLRFNQYEMIQKIYFYYNSKFISGPIDDEGDRKFFFNINKNPCKVFSKAIDFDTKNIRLLTVGGGDPYKTWFMERDLKYWMRVQQFGKVLNRIFQELPIFGTVVLKIVEGVPYFVDLRNFIVEQSADTLEEMNYKTEIHTFTPGAFRDAAAKMKWPEEKVKQVIDLFHQMKGTSHIRVYERYGEVCETDAKGAKKYPFKRVFLADVGVDSVNEQGEVTAKFPGVELSSDVWKPEECPYWEFHAEKVPGRWLGVGVVESLEEAQIALNESANLQSKGGAWAALRVFQTKDSAINRNMMTDVRNGEILNVDSDITQIDMSERNLSYFAQNDAKWLRNRDELTFSYDVVQGERSPAGTPLGQTKINLGQTLSYFETIQENVALDIKEMLYEVIIPSFQKQNTAEHTVRLVGQDLDQYIQFVKNTLVLKEIIRFTTTGKFPSSKDKETMGLAIEEAIKQGKEHIMTIPKNSYEGIKYDVDIDITGESVDTRVRSATRFAILQAITADPTALVDPTKKKIIAGIAEDGGINPSDFFGVDNNRTPAVPSGGGVSAPQMGAQIPGQTMSTV